MKTRQLLRFYFYAEGAEEAINNLITYLGCSSFCAYGADAAADKIIYLIGCKDRLSELWSFLDGVISRFGGEREVLHGYASGTRRLNDKTLKRVLMRFRRRAVGAQRFGEALSLLRKYAVFCRPMDFSAI